LIANQWLDQGHRRAQPAARCEIVGFVSQRRREEIDMSSTEQALTSAARAQAPGIKRTDLQRHDLSAPGREVIQNRVEISPEAPLVRHKHPGEEVIYVLEGSLEYHIDGRQPRTYSAGEALLVPAETVHAVRGNGTELATFIIEKGKPFIVVVD
jgi:quercetin dioxygenase-like cupin family protein